MLWFHKMKCIYCLQDEPLTSFKKREHVLPQSFGKFTPDNLILSKEVCDQCNEYFGEKLELILGRDSYEGIERYRHGIKPRKEPLKRTRVDSRLCEGEWKGLKVIERYSGVSGEFGIEKKLQVGFFNRIKQEYTYFEPQEIPLGEELEELGYELKGAMIWLIAEEGSELDYLIELLRKNGIDIKPNNELVNQKIPNIKFKVASDITIDRVIFRALSKVAFNYLCYVEGRDFVLAADFDGIRRFIRYDEGDAKDYFDVNIPPILHDDQRLQPFNVKLTEGHLITVGWRGMDIICLLSLFNTNTYLIILCHEFRGIWRPIRSGHHFDLTTAKIDRLMPISKTILL